VLSVAHHFDGRYTFSIPDGGTFRLIAQVGRQRQRRTVVSTPGGSRIVNFAFTRNGAQP
jgi:hypothetical protein